MKERRKQIRTVDIAEHHLEFRAALLYPPKHEGREGLPLASSVPILRVVEACGSVHLPAEPVDPEEACRTRIDDLARVRKRKKCGVRAESKGAKPPLKPGVMLLKPLSQIGEKFNDLLGSFQSISLLKSGHDFSPISLPRAYTKDV